MKRQIVTVNNLENIKTITLYTSIYLAYTYVCIHDCVHYKVIQLVNQYKLKKSQ